MSASDERAEANEAALTALVDANRGHLLGVCDEAEDLAEALALRGLQITSTDPVPAAPAPDPLTDEERASVERLRSTRAAGYNDIGGEAIDCFLAIIDRLVADVAWWSDPTIDQHRDGPALGWTCCPHPGDQSTTGGRCDTCGMPHPAPGTTETQCPNTDALGWRCGLDAGHEDAHAYTGRSHGAAPGTTVIDGKRYRLKGYATLWDGERIYRLVPLDRGGERG